MLDVDQQLRLDHLGIKLHQYIRTASQNFCIALRVGKQSYRRVEARRRFIAHVACPFCHSLNLL